jgi:hypothetical protein
MSGIERVRSSFAKSLPIVAAGLMFFALVFLAGFALGMLREIVLRAFTGPDAARLLELPVMIAISWLAARFVMRRLGPFPRSDAYDIGLLAFVLLQIAEFLFGYWILRITPLAWLASNFTIVGFLSLLAQALLIIMPAFASPPASDSHNGQPS